MAAHSPTNNAELRTENMEHAAFHCCRLSSYICLLLPERQESVTKANGGIFSEACFHIKSDSLGHS